MNNNFTRNNILPGNDIFKKGIDIYLITLIPSQTRNTFIVFPIETKSIGNYFINVIHRQEIKPGSSS